jgi:NADH-quinone oxidoreductase subunit H
MEAEGERVMVLEQLATQTGLPEWLLRGVLAPLVYPGLGAFAAVALFIIWAERKIAAKVQMRVGPLYVARRLGGALQLLADGIRITFQEIIVPVTVEKKAYVAAPIFAFAIVAASLAVIPGGPGVYGFSSSVSLLVPFALLGLIPIVIAVMGWASNNKFTYIGAGREILVTVAGEVTLLASLLATAMMYGSLDINKIVTMQIRTGIPGIVVNPIAAFLFFVAALLMTDRIPFDVVLGEQEIVQGPYTEYTGLLFVLNMALDYGKLYALMLLFSDLFLGGWMPFDGVLLGSLTVFIKTIVLMLIAIFLRSVYGRMRIDQIASMFWSRLFPLALASLVISAAVHVVYTP